MQLNDSGFPIELIVGSGIMFTESTAADGYTTDLTIAATATNIYSNSPQFDLTNPSATQIGMGPVAVTFGGTVANYAARTFTITAPTVPTWYYVTIADPDQEGEGSSPTLTATCQTSDALCGVPGNTYIGAIQAVPAGGSENVLAGGWPAPASVIVTI